MDKYLRYGDRAKAIAVERDREDGIPTLDDLQQTADEFHVHLATLKTAMSAMGFAWIEGRKGVRTGSPSKLRHDCWFPALVALYKFKSFEAVGHIAQTAPVNYDIIDIQLDPRFSELQVMKMVDDAKSAYVKEGKKVHAATVENGLFEAAIQMVLRKLDSASAAKFADKKPPAHDRKGYTSDLPHEQDQKVAWFPTLCYLLKGMSYSEIGELTGFSKQQVSNIRRYAINAGVYEAAASYAAEVIAGTPSSSLSRNRPADTAPPPKPEKRRQKQAQAS